MLQRGSVEDRVMEFSNPAPAAKRDADAVRAVAAG
jgi:hypothetical protein